MRACRSADLPTGLLLVSSVDTVGLRCAIARRTLVAVAVVVILVDLHIGAAETGFVFTTRRRSGPFGCVDLVRAVGAAAYPLKSGQRNPRGCIQRRLSLTRVSLQPEEKAPPRERTVGFQERYWRQQQDQMALASRLTLAGAPAEDPEDFFGASLSMFDDVINLRRFLLVIE